MFNFKKKYGQNFLIDDNIPSKIVSLADIDSDTLVIEIGPGGGALTKKIEEKTDMVLCFEIDKDVKELLEKNIKKARVIYADFLKVNLNDYLKLYDYKKLYIMSNLPYYITTPIIEKIISSNINPDNVIIMVQKEVGDRYMAKCGHKEYGSITVYLNYYFNIKKLMNVSRNVFMPRPNVDSVVLELSKRSRESVNPIFFKLVRDSFRFKRKNLKNNLKGYDLDKISSVLCKHGLSLSVRAEDLPLSIFIEIANSL